MTHPQKNAVTQNLGRAVAKYHFALALFVVFVLAVVEGIFLYQYFWQPLSATRLIVSFKKQAAIDRVEIERFKNIEAFHGAKMKPRDINPASLADPFIPSR